MKKLLFYFEDDLQTRGLPSTPPPEFDPFIGGGNPSTTPPTSGDE